MNDELVAYIRDQIARDVSRDTITHTLKEVGGWNDDDIKEVFITIDRETPRKEPEIPQTEPQRPIVVHVEPIQETVTAPLEHTEQKTKRVLPVVIVIISVVIILAGSFVGYHYFISTKDASQELSSSTSTTPRTQPTIRGQIILPKEIVMIPKAVSSFPTEPFKVYQVAQDGTFDVPISATSVNRIIAVAPDREFSYIAIVTPTHVESGHSVHIDLASTAQALVFLDPTIITQDPIEASTTLALIQQNKDLPALIGVIAEKIPLQYPAEDIEFKNALTKVIEGVRTQIPQ